MSTKQWQQTQPKINFTDSLIQYAIPTIGEVIRSLGSSADGLTQEEAASKLEIFGSNEVVHEKKISWIVELYQAFANTFTLVLLILDIISFFTDVIFPNPADREFVSISIITTMILLSGLLRFFQEYRSNKASQKLKALVKNTTTVIRKDVGKFELNIESLVPGDVIQLSAGDMIPADVRLLTSKDLFVTQSSLTGEAKPIEKYAVSKLEKKYELTALEFDNLCFLGTNVVSGSATAIVVGTGIQTYFGTIVKSMEKNRALTSFDKGVNQVSRLLISFMLVMVPIVFLINGFTKSYMGNENAWLAAFLFAISIAVGLTPEMLPMIVTSNLVKGSLAMAKHKTVVKRLNAIQNFGAMNILCTDKTGTLTQDKIVLERHLDVHGNDDHNCRILKHAYINSFFQTGLKNLLDVAVIEHGNQCGFDQLQNVYKKVDEIPFDFQRRRMSVVVQDKTGKKQLVTKGAVEEMLSICSFAEYHNQIEPITDSLKKEIITIAINLNKEGMRVLAIAQKNDISDHIAFSVSDESNMVLLGFVAFLDPVKESAAPAIKALQEYGVEVKILTGDNEIVAQKVCKDVGLKSTPILLGKEIEQMTDDMLQKKAIATTVFAKLSPIQKLRIIKALQKSGNTVGFMGDGINDASAMRASDVSISVDTAVDIAKESADIILLEKSLLVLKEGVVEGRKTFGNMIKYIKMTASSNFGNMFSVLIASAFLPFLPMLSIHILIQNLLYDISQISIPWDKMDNEYLKKNRPWSAMDITRFMVWIGPISSIFDITTYLLMFYVFHANTIAKQSLFQTGWFVEGLLSQTLIVHMIRTSKIPFIQSRATLPVMLTTLMIMGIGILIPYTAFGTAINLTPLPWTYFPWLVATLLCYCLLTQLVKSIYIKRYNTWL